MVELWSPKPKVEVRILQPLSILVFFMSQLNLKFIAAFLIFCFSLTELLVFNEEVFLFVCFFVFFNAVSTFGGSSVKQAFQDIGEEFEKSYLYASKEAKTGISELIVKKTLALQSIDHVVVFLNAFSRIVVQKSLINVSNSFYEKTQICLLALQAFKSSKSSAIGLADPISQVFAINAKAQLKASSDKNASLARMVLASSTPKSKSRLVDRLLSQGLLSPVSSSLTY